MMRRTRIAGVAALVAVATGASVLALTGAARGDDGPQEAEIRALFDQWNATLATGDSTLVADRYAAEAVLLPTVAGHVHNTPAEIIAYFNKFLPVQPQGTITESVVRVLGEDLASHSGLYRFTFGAPGSGPATADARFTYLYEKQNGEWKILEHHSSKVPA